MNGKLPNIILIITENPTLFPTMLPISQPFSITRNIAFSNKCSNSVADDFS